MIKSPWGPKRPKHPAKETTKRQGSTDSQNNFQDPSSRKHGVRGTESEGLELEAYSMDAHDLGPRNSDSFTHLLVLAAL